MNIQDAIASRRSIRCFKSTNIAPEILHVTLAAGLLAPSAKNRQPWRFIVVQGESRIEMGRVMRTGLHNATARGEDVGSSLASLQIMEQAPATVFVFNPEGLRPWATHSITDMFNSLVDAQSIGAAIQNIALAACDVGLGSLWVCDVLYAYDELSDWLQESGAMLAALCLGYPDECPLPRQRKEYDGVVRMLCRHI